MNKSLIKWVNEIQKLVIYWAILVILSFLLFLIGLELDHAYSILDARQVAFRRLVCLRNPWGKKQWTKWSRSLKEKLVTSSENDGVFWMRMY